LPDNIKAAAREKPPSVENQQSQEPEPKKLRKDQKEAEKFSKELSSENQRLFKEVELNTTKLKDAK